MPAPKAQPAAGADPVIVDSKHYKVEFENEHMRVLRVTYGPHEKAVRHSHPGFVALALTDVEARFTRPDNTTEDHRWRAGDVYWNDGGACLPENLGGRTIELILFELKPKTATRRAATAWIADDPVDVDAKHYKTEFENERIRVLRATYGPHERSAMHDHPPLAVVFLSDHHCRFAYEDGHTEEIREKAGKVLWMQGVRHLPENLADTPLRVVLVEVKG